MTTSPAYTKIGLESFQEFSGGVMVAGEEFIPAHVRQLVYNGGMVSPIILYARTGRWVYQISVHPGEDSPYHRHYGIRPRPEIMVARPPFYENEHTIIQVACKTGGLVGRYLSFLPGGFYQVKVFTDINKFLRWTQKRNWLPM
jgi:hypothetical protein